MHPINNLPHDGPARKPAARPLDFAGSLSGRVCATIEGALEAATCAHIIAAVTDSFEAAGKSYPPSYRDNDRAVVDDPELARALFSRLRTALPERTVDRHGGAWRIVGLNERFRFCRYEGGQCFRVHRDGAHAPSQERRSLLTLQIYLDEGFTGGHTRFYEARHGSLLGSIEARTGRALLFDHDLWHDGEAVTRGRKHVLRTDVVYERMNADADADADADSVLEGHTGYVFSLLKAHDGALFSGSRDRTVRRWSRDRGSNAWRCTHVLRGHAASVLALVEPRPGVVWSASRDRTIREWSLDDGTSRVVHALGGAVSSLALLGERDGGGAIAAGTAAATIAISESIDGARVLRELAGHTGWVWSLASLGSALLASGSEDATIRLWDVTSGECLSAASPGRGPVHALAVLDDATLAAGFADGHIVVYAVDCARGTLAPIAVHAAHDGEVYAVQPLSGGRLATAGEDDRALILERSDGACVASLVHRGFVRTIVRLDDATIATGSYDACVRVWPT